MSDIFGKNISNADVSTKSFPRDDSASYDHLVCDPLIWSASSADFPSKRSFSSRIADVAVVVTRMTSETPTHRLCASLGHPTPVLSTYLPDRPT